MILQNFELRRLPASVNPSLRAWDAADELLLSEFSGMGFSDACRILLVNDQFGALSVALHTYECTVWTDSIVSAEAIGQNCARNQCRAPVLLPLTQAPIAAYDVILLKLPKTHSLLAYQLATLARLHPNAKLVAGGMLKYMPRSQQHLFDLYYQTVTTSLAVKKARLILAGLARNDIAEPVSAQFYCDELGQPISSAANVYGAERLDLGARAMMSVMSTMPSVKTVVDLGCGNGVLGIAYQQLFPSANVTLVDESYMAVASAVENFQNVFGHTPLVAVANGMPADLNNVDLIVCNPPFHQEHVLTDDIAWQMFVDARRALAAGGELWVVGNRNLNYHHKLTKHFEKVTQVFSNSKFVVLRCSEPRT